MLSFRYTAIGPGGEVQRGLMDAASESDVIARLQAQGSMPMRAEPAASGSTLTALLQTDFAARRGLRKQEVADVVRELSTMLGAGQDLDRALRYMEETAPNPRVARVVTGLRDAVRDGSPLSVALGRYPGSFSRLLVGLVRAGEAGGKLALSLARMADLLDRQRSMSASITSALIYPTLLMLAAIGSVALLLTQVLPQFVPMFEQSGAALPASTQFLIDAGAAVSSYGLQALLVFAALTLIARALLRRPGPRLLADRILLRLPIIGSLMREILAARFTRVLGTLLVNGVSLITALGVVRDALGNLAAVNAVELATTSARGGGGLAQPLAETRVFPARAIHLLRLGEENAQLGPMALRAADIHEERTRLALQRLVALLVPAITILMGVAVAGIVASLMTAMLSLNDLAGT
ncbi:MAG: ral secretion pathway protein [Acetobacteraceae bacterium]|jgi:general secretion pathway protein F|nr:ral secretion pathway protein [Acetobacteraceae bacterium]MEA2790835.1 ral secretion pathway protein [Acetobacteraceae bacterium]